MDQPGGTLRANDEPSAVLLPEVARKEKAMSGQAATPHNGVSTSMEAAASMGKAAGRMRAKILAHIACQGLLGATCDEVEQALGVTHQSCSARIWDLHRKGDLIRTTSKRPTRSGRNAYVYVAANGGRSDG